MGKSFLLRGARVGRYGSGKDLSVPAFPAPIPSNTLGASELKLFPVGEICGGEAGKWMDSREKIYKYGEEVSWIRM